MLHKVPEHAIPLIFKIHKIFKVHKASPPLKPKEFMMTQTDRLKWIEAFEKFSGNHFI